ncbi:hypothetical protein FSP39_001997 [Pinctada imbricata]|uniref:Galactosylceramide sulfotransferase-like n=1 Tax=Pinctada imbricata TaxID=66713 RepID=A0AA88YLD2_PINIB|nr:hypothetical protein FSP39_001997 [Pinctada imbricata]
MFTMKKSYHLVVPMNQLVSSLSTPMSHDFNVTSTTEGPKCRKKLTVAFLKVHKAGSTTIMNIFLRFAIRNNLNIALPKKSSGYGFNYLGYGKTLNKSNIVPLPANETYSILCNHVVYSKSFDFGLNKTKFNDLHAVENYVRKLDSEFQFVMLMEYFDESLIMLRRLLCWDVKEVLYVPLNVNRKAKKEHVQLSSLAEEYLLRFNYADFRLYDYFKISFMQRLKSYGQDLEDEVEYFRSLRARVTAFCVSKSKGILDIPASVWNDPFIVTLQDCLEMTMPELPMLHRLINVANERYNSWRKHFMYEEEIKS